MKNKNDFNCSFHVVNESKLSNEYDYYYYPIIIESPFSLLLKRNETVTYVWEILRRLHEYVRQNKKSKFQTNVYFWLRIKYYVYFHCFVI